MVKTHAAMINEKANGSDLPISEDEDNVDYVFLNLNHLME